MSVVCLGVWGGVRKVDFPFRFFFYCSFVSKKNKTSMNGHWHFLKTKNAFIIVKRCYNRWKSWIIEIRFMSQSSLAVILHFFYFQDLFYDNTGNWNINTWYNARLYQKMEYNLYRIMQWPSGKIHLHIHSVYTPSINMLHTVKHLDFIYGKQYFKDDVTCFV